jgi:hypothetical protein
MLVTENERAWNMLTVPLGLVGAGPILLIFHKPFSFKHGSFA